MKQRQDSYHLTISSFPFASRAYYSPTVIWADPCRTGFNTTDCDPVPINVRRRLAEEFNDKEKKGNAQKEEQLVPASMGNRHRRLLLPRPICQGAFDAAKAIASATKCEDGKVFTEDSICEGFVVRTI